MREIGAICFDAFGTIVEITSKKQPLETLFRIQAEEITKRMLTRSVTIQSLPQHLAELVPKIGLARLEHEIETERSSIRMRQNLAPIWDTLRRAGLRTAR